MEPYLRTANRCVPDKIDALLRHVQREEFTLNYTASATVAYSITGPIIPPRIIAVFYGP
jgi:hypothetical protein